jgi:hypothetical protein
MVLRSRPIVINDPFPYPLHFSNWLQEVCQMSMMWLLDTIKMKQIIDTNLVEIRLPMKFSGDTDQKISS